MFELVKLLLRNRFELVKMIIEELSYRGQIHEYPNLLIVGNKMLQCIPTASYDDPNASALCHYVKIEQDDFNQKFLTSLTPEWLMYTIVWRNRDDLDTMSLDDVYNYLKVYEPEVQKKSELNTQNMAFISSSNTSSGKCEVHTASVPTASTQDWSYMANEEENHALVADDEVPTEFALMAK
nr:hypothetical protein [Tanacetum cinerariifolium]